MIIIFFLYSKLKVVTEVMSQEIALMLHAVHNNLNAIICAAFQMVSNVMVEMIASIIVMKIRLFAKTTQHCVRPVNTSVQMAIAFQLTRFAIIKMVWQ